MKLRESSWTILLWISDGHESFRACHVSREFDAELSRATQVRAVQQLIQNGFVERGNLRGCYALTDAGRAFLASTEVMA